MKRTIELTGHHRSTWWNYTGKAEAKYNQFSGPAMNFTITPSEIFGAA